MEVDMAFYECTFIARADLSKNDVQKLTDTLAKIVTDGKGKIIKNEYWGLRTLAYKINKAGKGHYTMLGIETDPATLKEFERNISINEDIVRNLTVKVEKLDASPSVMLKKETDSYEAA
jgi:small subunit ribosomal protein S6